MQPNAQEEQPVITRRMFSKTVVLFLVLSIASSSATNTRGQQPQAPALLTFNELVELYENDTPAPALANKLNRLLTTPFVSNAAGTRGPRSVKTTSGSHGPYLRFATWNIERGLEFNAVKAALSGDPRFFRRLAPANRSSKFNLTAINQQALELSRADVIVLNEVDWGLKRTDYRNVARELATALQMNYAYGRQDTHTWASRNCDPESLPASQCENHALCEPGPRLVRRREKGGFKTGKG